MKIRPPNMLGITLNTKFRIQIGDGTKKNWRWSLNEQKIKEKF